eukprot:TRINITY_DN22682_c0_g1_i1.p1 TRINITY_DN22682_c0_g1~~TRINITY_DN22682_c0_g1_i1.p1  ORF type:complete len:246 (+),score=30.42 TRINITY_DN22682_c0_g1_i1:236-973(+)
MVFDALEGTTLFAVSTSSYKSPGSSSSVRPGHQHNHTASLDFKDLRAVSALTGRQPRARAKELGDCTRLTRGFYRWYMHCHRSKYAFMKAIAHYATDVPSMAEQQIHSHQAQQVFDRVLLRVMISAVEARARCDGMRLSGGFWQWRWTKAHLDGFYDVMNPGHQPAKVSFEVSMKQLLRDVIRTRKAQLAECQQREEQLGIDTLEDEDEWGSDESLNEQSALGTASEAPDKLTMSEFATETTHSS